MEIRGFTDTARRGRRRPESNPDTCNLDINIASRVLDLNLPPPPDIDSPENRLRNNSHVSENQMRLLPVVESRRGRGRRGCGARVVHSRRGMGWEQNSPSGGPQASHSSGEKTPPSGWSPPAIQPINRSPHCLRHPRIQPECSRGSLIGEGVAEQMPQNYSPNSDLGHHRHRQRLTLDFAGGGQGQMPGVQRGLLGAFTASTRVQEWLQHQNDRPAEVGSITPVELLQQERSGGSVSRRPLPSAVWVTMSVLELNARDYGGVSEVLGEPQQRWQEKGVPFYFVIFKGDIRGRNVKVSDCRAFRSLDAGTLVQDTIAPTIVHDNQVLDESISEFPTACLQEEPIAAVRGVTSLVHSRAGLDDTPQEVSEGVSEEDYREARPSIAMPSDGSSDSEWKESFGDFVGDDSSLECSESESGSLHGSIDLHHEIGFYENDGNLDDLDFRARYHDRFWQCTDTMLLGDRKSFRGPSPGPKARCNRRRPAAIKFFDLFFDNQVLLRMVEETNLYARQQGTGCSQQTNGGPLWVPTSALEMRAFIGVTILMGIKVLPTIRDYWKNNQFLHCALVPRVFIRNRFESLLRCVHLVDNCSIDTHKESPRYDKLAKVRWFIDDFVSKSHSLYNPDKFVTCDEIMVAYRGHYSSFRQYMPAKPTKYGFKFFAAVCNPSRYIYNLIPYVGASGVPDVGQGQRVVRDLTLGLDDVGHTIVCDNWFIAPKLFEDLYQRGIWAIGTVRESRVGLPQSMLGQKKGGHPRGTLIWKMHAQCHMACTCWFDSKPVYMLSTSADLVAEGVRSMRWVHGIREAISSTPQQVEYQSHMRGVDVVDQMRTDYSVQFYSHKWWHKHMFFIIDCWLNNSWILLKHDRANRGEKVYRQRLSYHMDVAEALIAPWLEQPSTCKVECLRHPSAIHYSSLRPRFRRRCIVCKKKTRFRCRTCGGTHMCVDRCFFKVHTQKKWALKVLRPTRIHIQP